VSGARLTLRVPDFEASGRFEGAGRGHAQTTGGLRPGQQARQVTADELGGCRLGAGSRSVTELVRPTGPEIVALG